MPHMGEYQVANIKEDSEDKYGNDDHGRGTIYFLPAGPGNFFQLDFDLA